MGTQDGQGPHLPRSPRRKLKSIAAELRKDGVLPKKSLGQHWLISDKATERIASAAAQANSIIEVGPGFGALTFHLAATAENLIAIETDPSLVEYLQQEYPHAQIIHQDVIKADLAQLLQQIPSPRAIVSNLPYNISTRILGMIGDAQPHLDFAVLMMQREVAERIMAPVGDRRRGSLSVFLQSSFKIARLFGVPPGAFYPPPKVNSTVLRLDAINVTLDEQTLELVRAAFKSPRKTIMNNLIQASDLDRSDIEEALLASDVQPSTRPHEIENEEWKAIADKIQI